MSTPREPVAHDDRAGLLLLRPDVRFDDRLELARAALDLLRSRFGALVASLGIADFGLDQLQVLTDASVDDDLLPSFVAFPLSAHLMLTDALGSSDVRVLAADEYTAAYPTAASVVRRPEVDTLIAVGFQRGGVTGAVSLALPSPPDARVAGDLQATAALIGDALARWAEANRRNRQAAELQRSLAPGDRSTRLDVVRRAVHVPASPSDAIGGDWYDVFDLPDGRLVAVVGDVAGRGADAVVAMAQTSAALRALLVCDTAPHHAIEQLDRFCTVTRDTTGTTCVVAVIDPERGTAELCHAGHPAALLVTDGRVDRATASSGPLIGFPDGTRVSQVVPFPRGTTLMLYSNGLVRAAAAASDRQVERLADVVSELPDGPPGMLVAELFDRWIGTDAPDDDLVVLALRRPDPEGATFSSTEDAVPASITRLRHALAGWLDEHGCGSIAPTVELAVSELLANVVEHAYRARGTGRMIVEARLTERALDVAVIDDGSWSTQIVDSVRGRGLGIVEQLSTSRSIRTGPHGTTVRVGFARPV